jgi:peroxiredoxin
MTGDGPDVGAVIPFAERDVISGAEISSRTLRGRRTLLFFSEGVMCQACFEQIRDIEGIGGELERRDIRLVSITPDSTRTLREAMDAYDIDTPMIADDDRTMSAAFDTLGQGMHSDTPGHAFVLLDRRGKVAWQRDYWLEPYERCTSNPRRCSTISRSPPERKTMTQRSRSRSPGIPAAAVLLLRHRR